MLNTKQAPVVIVGMHRSGTSMTTRLLRDIGYNIGIKRDENDESLFFWKINDWLFRQLNCTWDRVDNFQYLDDVTKVRLTEVLEKKLQGLSIIEYFGAVQYLKGTNFKTEEKWAWKDPKNTFTLELWERVFPNLKVIHIYREPIDVALSLQKRASERIINFKQNNNVKLKEKLSKGKVQYCDSFRCLNLIEGIKLWEDYVSKSLRNENALHLKYEEIVTEPTKGIDSIAQYLGETVPTQVSDLIGASLDKSRVRAFRNKNIDPMVLDYVRKSDLIKSLGYEYD